MKGSLSCCITGMAKSPASFLKELRRDKGGKMQKYVCDACGYIYDPAENDNVSFDDLPEDWVCPVCGVGKDMFSPVD